MSSWTLPTEGLSGSATDGSGLAAEETRVDADPQTVRRLEAEVLRLQSESEELRRRLAAAEDAEEEEVDQLTDLQEALQRTREELAAAATRQRELEDELATARELSRMASDFLAVARSNATSISQALQLAETRLRAQEQELFEAHQEVEALEAELRWVAGDSAHRSRRPSVVGLVTGWYSRRRSPAKSAAPSPSRESARGAVAMREVHFNETVSLLRENITALTLALEGREQLMRELSEEIADLREEAAER